MCWNILIRIIVQLTVILSSGILYLASPKDRCWKKRKFYTACWYFVLILHLGECFTACEIADMRKKRERTIFWPATLFIFARVPQKMHSGASLRRCSGDWNLDCRSPIFCRLQHVGSLQKNDRAIKACDKKSVTPASRHRVYSP